jgi:signal peptide peptidase SppA
MKLLRISQEIYGRPLLITRAGFDTVHSLIQNKLNGHKPSFFGKLFGQEDMDPMDDMDDDDPTNMDIEQGIAYINIQGVIGKKLSLLEQMCGACDVDVLREKIEMAATHPDVEMICFLCDSPGGSVSGVPEMATYIKHVNDNIKPCVCLVDGMCCSAAYYMMASCSEIVTVGSTSYVGSIGVYTYLLDSSRQYEAEGITPVLIKAGTNKAENMPGMPITDEMKAKLQKEVDYIYEMFTSHVAASRPQISKENTMQGHAYYSEESIERGLVDYSISHASELFS